MLGWFRDESGKIITAQLIDQIGKDKVIVEDVTNFYRRYTIHIKYFHQTGILHGMS